MRDRSLFTTSKRKYYLLGGVGCYCVVNGLYPLFCPRGVNGAHDSKIEANPCQLSSGMVLSVTTHLLPGNGKVVVRYDRDIQFLGLAYSSYGDGREYSDIFTRSYLKKVHLLALDPDILDYACSREPDIIDVLHTIAKIGWTIPIGRNTKDLVFVLKYTIVEGPTEIEQGDRDFTKSLARRIEVLEKGLKKERRRNRSLGELVARMSITGWNLLSLPEYGIRVPVGIEKFPDLYDCNGTHLAAQEIQDQIWYEMNDPIGAKLVRLAQLPSQLGLNEPIITSTDINSCAPCLFGGSFGNVQWMPFQVENKQAQGHTNGTGCMSIGYTTGHILIFAAVSAKKPLHIRELAGRFVDLDLKASNGLTPMDMLTSIINGIVPNSRPDFVLMRQSLGGTRAELAQILRDKRPARPIVADDDISDSEDESISQILGELINDPPEYKND